MQLYYKTHTKEFKTHTATFYLLMDRLNSHQDRLLSEFVDKESIEYVIKCVNYFERMYEVVKYFGSNDFKVNPSCVSTQMIKTCEKAKEIVHEIDHNCEKYTYDYWKTRFEVENDVVIWDDDGGRILFSEGKFNKLMTYGEAKKYLMLCTMEMRADGRGRTF